MTSWILYCLRWTVVANRHLLHRVAAELLDSPPRRRRSSSWACSPSSSSRSRSMFRVALVLPTRLGLMIAARARSDGALFLSAGLDDAKPSGSTEMECGSTATAGRRRLGGLRRMCHAIRSRRSMPLRVAGAVFRALRRCKSWIAVSSAAEPRRITRSRPPPAASPSSESRLDSTLRFRRLTASSARSSESAA